MTSLNTSISTSLQNNSTREWIYYFDVMKGIGMVLVVLGHVMLFTFGIEPPQAGKFLYFHMPLFFYISGFLKILFHCILSLFLCTCQFRLQREVFLSWFRILE